ncbi:MAG: DNA replication/repair protein RecF [Alphaproteobacteria bacterium]
MTDEGVRSEGAVVSRAARHTRLERLMLSDFRSFASADLRFDDGPVVLIGPNGGGKTNILEAVSLLTPGRGLLGAKLGDMTRRGTNNPRAGWAVSAEISGLAGPIKLGTGLARDAAGRDRRAFRLEGENASPRDIAELVRLAWLTPAMERLFEESAGTRRRFFDRLVATLDAAHGARLGRYERALSERQHLLSEGTGEPAWLSGLERIIAEEGVAISAARLDMLTRLSAQIAAGGPWADEELFPRAEIRLEGGLEGSLASKPAVLIETEFEHSLEASRARDAGAGRALEGAHRSDLKVHHSAKNMPAEECSTGEQKALLLNIVLAHIRLVAEATGSAPIVLLDEVAAHLDAVRREALFASLDAAGAQVFLTGTDMSAFGALASRAQVFEVDHSQARAARRHQAHGHG